MIKRSKTVIESTRDKEMEIGFFFMRLSSWHIQDAGER